MFTRTWRHKQTATPFGSIWNIHPWTVETQTATHLVEVDGHGTVAHLWGFVVGVTDGRKRHPASARPHGHAQSVARRFRGRRGVTHHQTFSLQHYRFCVILAADLGGPPKNQEQQSERDRAARKGGRAQTRHSSNVPASCRCSFLWWLAGLHADAVSNFSHPRKTVNNSGPPSPRVSDVWQQSTMSTLPWKPSHNSTPKWSSGPPVRASWSWKTPTFIRHVTVRSLQTGGSTCTDRGWSYATSAIECGLKFPESVALTIKAAEMSKLKRAHEGWRARRWGAR